MTEKTINIINTIEDLTVEDQLSEITADLIEFKTNQIFLLRLFSKPQGEWLKVISLCDNLENIRNLFDLLPEKTAANLQVTWLNYPDSVYGEGYCLITFFEDELHWSNVALYNKQQLEINL